MSALPEVTHQVASCLVRQRAAFPHHDSHPKRRGMTRGPELMDAGINVAFGRG